MSGIIGGAGSKSGVLGLQDIDTNRPAFSARGYSITTADNYVDYGNGVSDVVDFNVGNHYTPSTGTFLCPISGLYKFSVADIAYATDGVYRFYYRVDNTNIGPQMRLDTGATGSDYEMGELGIIWKLTAGETMRIYFTGTSIGANDPSYKIFSGYLIG